MNLVLGTLWLLGAALIFAEEYTTGVVRWRILGLNLSIGWLLLLLAAYNFVRWYGQRALRQDQHAFRAAHEARLRQGRQRERPEPDPTFDFTDPPPPPRDGPPRPPVDAPPSSN